MKFALATSTALLVLTLSAATPHETRTGQQAASAAIQEFQTRLQEYVALRQHLVATLDPLRPTASGAELAARQTALVTAIQKARVKAKPGDLIPAAAAAYIRDVVLKDYDSRSSAEQRSTFSEVVRASRLAINRAYPANAALPTVPPLLLQQLPPLPDTLQYRFYGRHLLVLDGDLEVIVDFIENVLPAR